MNNGQWLETLAEIQRLLEICLLANDDLPDDIFPVTGALRIRSSLDWRLTLSTHRLATWLPGGRPCLGLTLAPEGNRASFEANEAPNGFVTIELPNWPGLSRLRAALQKAADAAQAEAVANLTLKCLAGPGGRIMTRTRAGLTAHEILEMKARLAGRR